MVSFFVKPPEGKDVQYLKGVFDEAAIPEQDYYLGQAMNAAVVDNATEEQRKALEDKGCETFDDFQMHPCPPEI
jgi:hypothetical protein